MHTDDAFAQSAGYPGVFAHGMLSMGYLAEFLVQAGGVGAVRCFKTRFAKLTWPGDLITCRGRVTPVADEFGERRIECGMWSGKQTGARKLDCSATHALPPAELGGTSLLRRRHAI